MPNKKLHGLKVTAKNRRGETKNFTLESGVPLEVLLPAVNQVNRECRRNCDTWGERERVRCRELCGPEYASVESDVFQNDGGRLRRMFFLDPVNRPGFPNGRRRWSRPHSITIPLCQRCYESFLEDLGVEIPKKSEEGLDRSPEDPKL